MSYEYNVPFVDFITSFGENDDADKFFDVNTEFEKLSVKESPVPKEKGCSERKERPILQEVCENIKNIESTQRQTRNQRILPASSQSAKSVPNSGVKLVPENLKNQILQGFSKSSSALRHKRHFQIVEEVNGELCLKNDEIRHAGVPRTIPSQRTKTLQHRSFEERQQLQARKREALLKKVVEEEKKNRVFHANPVPSYLKSTQQKSTRSAKTCAVKNTYELKSKSAVKSSSVTGNTASKLTSSKPLSIKSLNSLSQNVMEEEKKKRVFHANPVPSYLKSTQQNSTSSGKTCTTVKNKYGVKTSKSAETTSVPGSTASKFQSSSKSSVIKSSNNPLQNSTRSTFRARPAFVVRKQPFLPGRTEHIVKPCNVTLHSEKRAKARKEFEEKLRKHHKELEDEARARKEQELQREKEEIAELRKKLVHKAQPVPLYKSALRANSNGSKSKNTKVADRFTKREI